MCRPVRYTKPALPEHLTQPVEEELQLENNIDSLINKDSDANDSVSEEESEVEN